MNKVNVAILGATGAVGREMLKVLEEEQIELSPELLEGVAGGEPGPCIAFTCDKCEGNEADNCRCD